MARNAFAKSLKNNGALKVEATLVNSRDYGNGAELKVIEFARAVHWGNCQNSSKDFVDPENENFRNVCLEDCYEGKLRFSLLSDLEKDETFLIFIEESTSKDGGFVLIQEDSFKNIEQAVFAFAELLGMNLINNLYK